MIKSDLEKICVGAETTVGDVIRNLEQSGVQVVLVVDANMTLLGLVTDGDIRRGLLLGHGLEASVTKIMVTSPIVVDVASEREVADKLMLTHNIMHIPVVDHRNQLSDLFLIKDERVSNQLNNTLVIMAGGFGKRLMPHTKSCPKPMLNIAGRPMLEHIIERAIFYGFRNIVISVFYMPEVIKEYFKDGAFWNINITYIQEESPLGTAGALSLLSKTQSNPIVIINGDVLTDINFIELLKYHARQKSMATMAVRNYQIQNPFGVVDTDGIDIVGFTEKPVHSSNINAGIYVLDPLTLEFLLPNSVCDMPTLFSQVKEANHRTVVFPIHESWLDVGSPEDFKLANSLGSIPND